MNNEENLQTTSDSNHKVRVGLHATTVKFGDVRKDGSYNEDGIELSLAENKALFAIQKLLDKTNYEGNAPSVQLKDPDSRFKYLGTLPRITFTPQKYLEAYGLEKRKTKRGFMEYSNAERNAALYALYNLSRKRFKIIYKRKNYNGKRKPIVDRIETESELIRIYNGYKGLTEQEDEKLDKGEKVCVDGKLVIGVEVCPLLVDQIDSYFILLDPTLHSTAKEITGKKKYSRHIPLFIEWLTTKVEYQRRNKTTGKEVKIGLVKLAGKLRMYKLLEDSQWNKIEAILGECFLVGRGEGLLISGKIEDKMVAISLPKKYGSSTYKKRKLYLKNTEPLPIKYG